MEKYNSHIILIYEVARAALKQLDQLPDNAKRTLFVVDENNVLMGSLTDGDIRRGLLSGYEISDLVSKFIHKSFKYVRYGKISIGELKKFKEQDIFLIPVLDQNNYLVDILDLKKTKTILPLTALIMAGGRGERLKPLTDHTPKPMLQVGDKPILEHNIDHLISFGIKEIYISVKYLKEVIMNYFGDGSKKGISIKYIIEDQPLGTLGALAYIDNINHSDILVMNSDLLTNIDFEDFYSYFIEYKANMALVSIPYNVNVPYAVLETEGHYVNAFSEKPTYTYYSNGGIYLLNFKLKNHISKGNFYNATDLMEFVINQDELSLLHYPMVNYWLDIGKYNDFVKAQEDIKHLTF